ncbi:methyltransferase-like protein 23 [Trichonephila clavipes]|nr:methyltransferase-like protein 23 [Trichonephila clavipes]
MSINKLPASIPVEETIKKFHFTDETDIIDVPHPSFGMYVWPSAPVLGKYMWHNRNRLKGKITLELGSGTGLISVVAAKCGAHAILTDSKKYDSVFKIAEENMRLNDVDCENFEIQELTWGYITPFMVKSGQIHFILGSDVFYCPKARDWLLRNCPTPCASMALGSQVYVMSRNDFEDIIVTVSYLLKKNPDAEFWCAYENRCSDWNIDHLLKKWDLSCKAIPLEDFGADHFNIAGHDLPDGDRFNSCQVIYSQFGLAIHQNDHQARRRFVEWAQNEIAVVPDFHKRILFSDEAHFWLNGYVNKQNCRIWSEANPQVYVQTPLHPEKLTVWCALWASGILLQKR